MPIGGGSFTVQNKVLPGAYINFVSMGTNAKMGERGVAALPLELNWGPEGQVFKLDAADFNATSMKVFGYDPTDANIRNRRCINGIAKKLPAEPAQQGRKSASYTARRGQNDRLHPVDDRQPEAFSEEDQIFRDE